MTEQRYQSNIADMRPRLVKKESGVANGGEPPNDGGMESRVAKLEEAIKTLATKADVEKGFGDLRTEIQGARADIHKSMGDMKGWLIGVVITLFAAIALNQYRTDTSIQTSFAAVRQAQSVSSAPAPQQPLVVVVPQAPQPAQQEAPKAE